MSNTDAFGLPGFLRGSALACLLLAAPAQGADLEQPMEVRLEIVPACTLETSAADLDFGALQNMGGPTAGATDAQATLRLTCAADFPWSVYADYGENAAAGTQRRAVNGVTGDGVAYDLYSDGSRQLPFGTTEATAVSQLGTGQAQELHLYGRVPAHTQLGAAGTYRDKVVLTFSF